MKSERFKARHATFEEGAWEIMSSQESKKTSRREHAALQLQETEFWVILEVDGGSRKESVLPTP